MKSSKKIYAKGLGGPYLHFKRSLTYDNKLSLKKILEESITQGIEKSFRNEVTIYIEIGEGSIKVKIIIGAFALFNFVANYGSFRSGIDHLVNDVRNISSTVIEHVIEEENLEQNEIIYKARRLGIPGKVQRYLKKLDLLDNNDVNLDQRTVLIDDLKTELTNILSILEEERDRTLLIEETPNIIKRDIVNNMPTPIPGQLNLRYLYNQDTPLAYDAYVQDANHHQELPSLSESYFYRPELSGPRNEDED